MYSLKSDLAQKKKKQAIRRLSQSGKRLTPQGRNIVGGGYGRGRGRVLVTGARRPPKPGQSGQDIGNNPFFQATRSGQGSTQALPSISANNNSLSDAAPNPFFAAIDKPPGPVSEVPPPSYASVVSNKGRIEVPMSSFITRSPGHAQPTSQVDVDVSQGRTNTSNPFLTVQREGYNPRTHTVSLGQAAISTSSTLHLKAVPPELNNKEFLYSHFLKFGKVTNVKCNTVKWCATVAFQTHADAVKAKKGGKQLSPNHPPVKMFWHAQRSNQPIPSAGITRQPPLNVTSKYIYTSNPTNPRPTNDEDREESNDTSKLKDNPMTQQQQHPMPEEVHMKLKTKGSVLEYLGPQVKGGVREKRTVGKPRRKLINYEEEEWLPSRTEVQVDDDDEVDEGVGEGETGLVRKSVLRDLGNKYIGDEMDTIARTAPHNYYLRSLHQPDTTRPLANPTGYQRPPDYPISPPDYPVPPVITVCPYIIPKFHLPPPPTPKGNTAADYYEALEMRDQEIFKGMKKQTSLMDAHVIVGTCPDMCPEKERYRREDTRRLSWFEMRHDCEPRNPRVDHALAVKEYSGSAADKEAPLPHDLRPLGVLQMTMDHLVTMVMDAGRERPYDWYDFIWNRTRGIRKDITIQHLCCLESVELIEKCARFHILCAHHLCEEDITTFDPKMNNENLNKCLLSLKEFYRDIRLQQKIMCPNEAEFCCYDILLHLTDGNALSLIEEYSPDIKFNPLITFAVDMVLSYEENNFIKLFKLIKSTTFLNACILHRYFPLIRLHGLKVLNRAHSMQKRCTYFPLQHLTKMLAFEDQSQAASFCQIFGLKLEDSDVMFDREKTTTINLEGISLPGKLSYHLVLSKNKKSMGEVVHGGPLPPRYIHTPHCSFTSETLDVLGGEASYELPTPKYSHHDLMDVVSILLEETVENVITELVQDCLEEAEVMEEIVVSLSTKFLDEVLEEVIQGLIVQVSKEAIEEMYMSCVLNHICKKEVEQVCEDVTTQLLTDICRSCVIERRLVEMAMKSVCGEIIELGVSEEIKIVALEAFVQAKQLKKEQMETLRQRFMQSKLRQYWAKWCHALIVSQHVQQCAEAIPPLPPLTSLAWQLERLLPSRMQKNLGSSGLKGDATQLEASRIVIEKKREDFYSALDLPLLLRESLLVSRLPESHSSPLPDIYWKLTLLHPQRSGMFLKDCHVLSWICSKLSFSPPSSSSADMDSPVVSLSVSSSPLNPDIAPLASSFSRRTTLNLAVSRINPEAQSLDLQERELAIRGTSCLAMFVSPPLDRSVLPLTFMTAGLDMIMTAYAGPGTRGSSEVPLLVIYSSELEESHLGFWYRCMRALEVYCQRKPISQIFWMKLKTNIFLSTEYPESVITELSESLQSLAGSSPPQPALFHSPVKEFIEEGLIKYFIPLVLSDSQKRWNSGLPSQPLPSLVELFNAVVRHLSSKALDERLQNLQWPLPEFAPQLQFSVGTLPPLCWNSAFYFEKVRSFLAGLTMPTGYHDIPSEEEVWSEQCAGCMRFVCHLSVSSSNQSIPFLSRIKSLLHKHWSNSDKSQCFVPWDQVILTSVEYTVASIDSDLWISTFHADDKEDDKFLPLEWLHAQASTSLTSADHVTLAPHRRRHKRHLTSPYFELLHATPTVTSHYPRPSASVGVSPTTVLRIPDKEERKRQRLENSIQREKELSQSFESQLEQWMSSSLPSNYNSLTPTHKRKQSPVSMETENKSISQRLEELSESIRTARWQEAVDVVHLHSLTNDYPMDGLSHKQ